MIRTRDFFLFLVIVAFLVVGIGTTLFGEGTPAETNRTVTFVEGQPLITASVSSDAPDREQNRIALREKIAAGATLYIQEDFYEADEIDNPDESNESALVQRCAGFASYSGPLLSNTNPFSLVEGARVVYGPAPQATSTASTPEVLAAIPLAGVASGAGTCLSTDVIGITLGGTVIRNTDVARYASFPENILIGYALDGFPIYGVTAGDVDLCGGASVAGQYRYQIRAGAETLINCFTGTPVAIK